PRGRDSRLDWPGTIYAVRRHPVCSGAMAFRLAMLTPYGPPATRGNAVTTSRVARGLVERGFEVTLWDLSAAGETEIESAVAADRPQPLHPPHAYPPRPP